MPVTRSVVCTFLVLLGILSIPIAATAQTKLRVGLLPFSEALAAVIADKEGLFKAEGLEIEITQFQSGALAVPALQSGRIDIAFSNTVSTLQAIEQGLMRSFWRRPPSYAARRLILRLRLSCAKMPSSRSRISKASA